MSQTSTKRGHGLDWHKDHCPCNGQPQPVSPTLASRQREIPNSGNYSIGAKSGFFRKPGSQNGKK